MRLYQLAYDVPQANLFALTVGSLTIAAGLVARRYFRRYALVLALLAGCTVAWTMGLWYGTAGSGLTHVGFLSVSLLPLSLPSLGGESSYVVKELFVSACLIAFLGMMQSVVIARSLAAKSGQEIDTRQEILGQGLANLVAPFVSSFAGSGSFNRSAAHYQAGARTPFSAVYASLLLGAIVLLSAPLIAWIPMPAIAGVLILVGYGLIEPAEAQRALRTRATALVFLLTVVFGLFVGLNAGVMTGVLVSLITYLWNASTPGLTAAEYEARDGRTVQTIAITGNLFFGSVRHVERELASLGKRDAYQSTLLVQTAHLTYIDAAGVALIAAETARRRGAGGNVYLHVPQPRIVEVLEQCGYRKQFPEALIEQYVDHPMKDLLRPTRTGAAGWQGFNKEGSSMEALAHRLRTTRLFAPLSAAQIGALLAHSEIKSAQPGDIIIRAEESMRSHLVVIDGKVEAQRIWSVPGENDKSYTWLLEPREQDSGLALLSAASHKVRLRALSEVRYLFLDAETVDEKLGWQHQFAEAMQCDETFRRRAELVKQVSVFRQLPLQNVGAAFERMRSVEVAAGATVIVQGDLGTAYYIIEEGEAEVMRTDPFTDATDTVAILEAGDAFGEEALLQNGYRNATVRMTTPGRLLVLEKPHFDELIQPYLVAEMEPETARLQLESGAAAMIDCRYDMEFEESRIPGAAWLPLDRIRWDLHRLDPNASYVVYCRSGRRSKAAAFLLRERNIHAVSLAGGIKAWPYEVDLSPLSNAGGMQQAQTMDGSGV